MTIPPKKSLSMVTSAQTILFKNIFLVFKSNYTREMSSKSICDYHLDSLVAWEVSQQVLADQVSLLIKPFAFEYIAFLRGGLAHFIKLFKLI